MAASLGGDVARAEQHLRSAHEAMLSYEALFAVDLARAQAWLSAARGELSTAVAEARRAADDAVARNAPALEVGALHDIVRFGRPEEAVERLEALTTVVDGVLVRSVAAHALALVNRDGAGLDAVSRLFESHTLDLVAAEASWAAARAHRLAGRRSSAYAARERARELVVGCEWPRTPALTWSDEPDELTAREREVAHLAGENLASRVIAERLGITTRTVDNLLGRVYVKLGVAGRKELAEVLGRPSAPSAVVPARE
jgi:DNA-binding CsgD family transcriptional regulator